MKRGRLLQSDRKLEALDIRLNALEIAVGRLCSNDSAGHLASQVSDVDFKVQKARFYLVTAHFEPILELPTLTSTNSLNYAILTAEGSSFLALLPKEMSRT